jgi:hypothetical protein
MSGNTINTPTVSAISKATSQHNNDTGRLLANELAKYLSGFDFHTRLTKREREILWLTIAADLELKVTRFDAERIGDHCFNSTISEITNIDHIIVDRIPTKRPTRFGSTDCKEYWLQGRALEAALIQCECVLTVKSKQEDSMGFAV